MQVGVGKAEIKSKALELFKKVSFSKTSVADIAASCGIGKGTVYLHFTSKKDILLAIIDERIANFSSTTIQAFRDQGLSSQEKVMFFFDRLVDEYFTVRELMFCDFESVQGKAVQEILRACRCYEESYTDLLVKLIPEAATARRHDRENLRLDIGMILDFVRGQIFLFMLMEDWNDRARLKATLAPIISRFWRALIESDRSLLEVLE